ncbi:hypothetical protein A7985_05570 [Pseudoalteromonas luteoviolacea]|uniref:Reverse transcriptase domain-containing protein n=1 Tax=Pseudoalteromonas luteoviolacea TaxID=43657 RepID=A0A1C0TVQ8_9GAMM|nr:reverse transcriptase domain-containing protein [Pseudoalteromonas luteoviolacea]OCQ23408.1 hypothetical protein A7985_05570 [Pseudoalteromonas luteoviolacea]
MTAYINFSRNFKKRKLNSTYQDHISSGSAVGLDKVTAERFENTLDQEIDTIIRKVNNETYKFTPYKQKLISKGADSMPRVISIPTYRDRLTLRSLCQTLSETYKAELHLEIPQVKISQVKDNITNRKYSKYIKIDISGYYPSIDHDMLLNILKRKTRKKQLISLIRSAIENPTMAKSSKNRPNNNRGVPQGLSISNILAEIYLFDFDKYFKNLDDIFYTRYVDDILIFCPANKVKAISHKCIEMLKDLSLNPHDLEVEGSKSCSGNLAGNFDYLGYKFSQRKTSLKKQKIERFESSIAAIFTTYSHKVKAAKNVSDLNKALKILEWRLNLRITGCIFNNAKRGWVFYFSQLDDLTLLFQIDATIKKLMRRFNVDKKITPKKLSKAYFEAQRVEKDSHKYIVNFDSFNTNEKKDFLEIYIGKDRLAKKSPQDIDRLFGMRIRKIIEELEQDLDNFS